MIRVNSTVAGIPLRRAITGRLHGRIGEVDIVATNWGKGALPWMVSRNGARLLCLARAETLTSALEQAKEVLQKEAQQRQGAAA